MPHIDFWTLLLVAACGYLAGMVGTCAYAIAVLRRLPHNDGGEAFTILLVLIYELVLALQLPKIGCALAAAAVGLLLFNSLGYAILFAGGTCFAIAGLFLAWLTHSNK